VEKPFLAPAPTKVNDPLIDNRSAIWGKKSLLEKDERATLLHYAVACYFCTQPLFLINTQRNLVKNASPAASAVFALSIWGIVLIARLLNQSLSKALRIFMCDEVSLTYISRISPSTKYFKLY